MVDGIAYSKWRNTKDKLAMSNASDTHVRITTNGVGRRIWVYQAATVIESAD